MKSDIALVLLSCSVLTSEPSASVAQTITLQGDVSGTGTFDVNSNALIATSVAPSNDYLDIGLSGGSRSGLRIGQLGSAGAVSAIGTAANIQLNLLSHGNRGVYVSSDSVGTLGGFVTSNIGSATNYLTIAPSSLGAAVQLIGNSTGTTPGNISIAVNPLDIGGQLLAPRINLSGAGTLPIVWGSSSSSGATILNSPDPTNNPLWISEAASGTTSMGPIGYFGFNSINVQDNLTNLEAGPASALAIKHSYGGSAIEGGRSALLVWLNPQTGTYTLGPGGTSSFYGAATFVASANQSAGGTASTCGTCGSGVLFGINPTVSLSSGATYWSSLAGGR